MIFAELGKCSATGHVGQLRLVHGEEEQWLIKEDVRAVWEISEKVELFTFGQLGLSLAFHVIVHLYPWNGGH